MMGNNQFFPSLFGLLRATFCKYQISLNNRHILEFFIFCPNNPYNELFSKIALKVSATLYFWRNRGKFVKCHFGPWRHLIFSENNAFSVRSQISTKQITLFKENKNFFGQVIRIFFS